MADFDLLHHLRIALPWQVRSSPHSRMDLRKRASRLARRPRPHAPGSHASFVVAVVGGLAPPLPRQRESETASALRARPTHAHAVASAGASGSGPARVLRLRVGPSEMEDRPRTAVALERAAALRPARPVPAGLSDRTLRRSANPVEQARAGGSRDLVRAAELAVVTDSNRTQRGRVELRPPWGSGATRDFLHDAPGAASGLPPHGYTGRPGPPSPRHRSASLAALPGPTNPAQSLAVVGSDARAEESGAGLRFLSPADAPTSSSPRGLAPPPPTSSSSALSSSSSSSSSSFSSSSSSSSSSASAGPSASLLPAHRRTNEVAASRPTHRSRSSSAPRWYGAHAYGETEAPLGPRGSAAREAEFFPFPPPSPGASDAADAVYAAADAEFAAADDDNSVDEAWGVGSADPRRGSSSLRFRDFSGHFNQRGWGVSFQWEGEERTGLDAVRRRRHFPHAYINDAVVGSKAADTPLFASRASSSPSSSSPSSPSSLSSSSSSPSSSSPSRSSAAAPTSRGIPPPPPPPRAPLRPDEADLREELRGTLADAVTHRSADFATDTDTDTASSPLATLSRVEAEALRRAATADAATARLAWEAEQARKAAAEAARRAAQARAFAADLLAQRAAVDRRRASEREAERHRGAAAVASLPMPAPYVPPTLGPSAYAAVLAEQQAARALRVAASEERARASEAAAREERERVAREGAGARRSWQEAVRTSLRDAWSTQSFARALAHEREAEEGANADWTMRALEAWRGEERDAVEARRSSFRRAVAAEQVHQLAQRRAREVAEYRAKVSTLPSALSLGTR